MTEATTNRVYLIGQTLMASALLYAGWDKDSGIPVMQLALVFGGLLLGHVMTEALNDKEGA